MQKGQKSRQPKRSKTGQINIDTKKRDRKVTSQKVAKTSQKSLKKAKQRRKEVRKLAKNTQQIAHPPKNKGKVKGYKSAKRITSPKKKDKNSQSEDQAKLHRTQAKYSPPSIIINGQTKKIKSKDQVTWIKPETKKTNQSAAKCAQNKEKTLDLIKLHENKIKDAINSKRDELTGIKVTLKINKAPIFQNMITSHHEPEEEATLMILMVEEVIKVEDTELSISKPGAEE